MRWRVCSAAIVGNHACSRGAAPRARFPGRGLPFGLVLLVSTTAGCAQIAREGQTVDELVTDMRSDDFDRRQRATARVVARSEASLRHVVIPRLALESARVPLEVSSVTGNVLRGRVSGGGPRALELVVSEPMAPGAVVRIELQAVEVIRLFAPP